MIRLRLEYYPILSTSKSASIRVENLLVYDSILSASKFTNFDVIFTLKNQISSNFSALVSRLISASRARASARVLNCSE